MTPARARRWVSLNVETEMPLSRVALMSTRSTSIISLGSGSGYSSVPKLDRKTEPQGAYKRGIRLVDDGPLDVGGIELRLRCPRTEMTYLNGPMADLASSWTSRPVSAGYVILRSPTGKSTSIFTGVQMWATTMESALFSETVELRMLLNI